MHAPLTRRMLDLSFLDMLLAELVLERIPSASDLPLAEQVAEVKERFGGTSAAIRSDRVEAAARQALSDMGKLRSSHRFVLAHSLAQPIEALGGRSVLDHEQVAQQLLNDWESAARDRVLKLSHWRGLFRSYMQAPAGEWQKRLRLLLSRTLEPVVKRRRSRPAWLDALSQHEHLLGDEPCLPYVDQMVAGEHDLLADLREHVDIPSTSWFWQQLKSRLFQQIASIGEAAFRASIDAFLELDRLIPLVSDDLLKAVLERYDAGKDRSVHPSLMDFSLKAWGSPQLARNSKWGLCRPSVRQMVNSWLAKDDLEDFYRLCNTEKEVDERRLEFWLRFKDQMTFTQILLGGRLRNSRDPDVRAFIAKKGERLGDLTASTSANNAIVMQIGGWLFIEFSEIGTAARAIRLGDGSIKTGMESYSLTSLRHIGEQLTHLPHPWEEKFLRILREKGFTPDDAKPRSSPPAPSGYRAEQTPRPNPPDQPRGDPLVNKLKGMGLEVVDNRPKGGALWVYTSRSTTAEVLSQIRSLGFRWKDNKKGFYLP